MHRVILFLVPPCVDEPAAQVEGLLKTVGQQRSSQTSRPNASGAGESPPGGEGGENDGASYPEPPVSWFPLSPIESPPKDNGTSAGELLGLGQFESLPPFEMIEDL